MKQLGCMYPYGLNDNVKGLGNISKLINKDKIVVYSLFNRHDRNRTGRRNKSGAYNYSIVEHLSELLAACIRTVDF